MEKYSPHWMGVLSVFVAGLTVLSARAQGTAPAGNQPVVFSDPAGNGLQLPGSPSPSSTGRPNFGSQPAAPHSIFGSQDNDAGDSMTPLPAPPVNSLNQMMQERKKHWAEMTPEEIFGLKPPEPDSNSKTTDADGTYHSPLEKFLMEQRLAQTGSTNLNSAHSELNFFDDNNGLFDQRRNEAARNGVVPQSGIFSRLLQNAQAYRTDDQEAAWTGVFSAPQPVPPTTQQLADMAAFQQLLQPTPEADPKFGATDFKAAASGEPAVDPNWNPRPVGYNPVGASFTPLVSNIGRPQGVAPPPSLTSSYQPPVAPPSWAPQPAPWTLGTPQLFVTPQRKY